MIHKTSLPQVDARMLAEEEEQRVTEIEEEQKRVAFEQKEKARLRHTHARVKERLKQVRGTTGIIVCFLCACANVTAGEAHFAISSE